MLYENACNCRRNGHRSFGSVAAKTVLNNPQGVPDYATSGVKGITNLYIEEWTEGYPPEQTNQLSVTERVGNQRHGRR